MIRDRILDDRCTPREVLLPRATPPFARFAWVVLAAALANSNARAQTDTAPVPVSIEPVTSAATLARAEAECAALDYEMCAETAMLVVVDPQASEEERARARWVAGSAQRIIGKDVDAQMNFRALIKDTPEFVPPDDTPAKVMQFFALVQSAVASERAAPALSSDGPTGLNLVVESVPVGALVSLDGVSLGKTPVHARAVRPGLHELRVEGAAPGDDVVVPVDVFADAKTAVRVTFRASREAVEKARSKDRIVDEAREEEEASIAGALTKGVGSVLACGAGTCSGCIAFASVLTLGNAFGLDSTLYSSIASGSCSVLWLVGALGALGLGGLALVDVVDMIETSGPAIVHAVDVVPPAGRGAPRTILFSAPPVELTADGDAAVAY